MKDDALALYSGMMDAVTFVGFVIIGWWCGIGLYRMVLVLLARHASGGLFDPTALLDPSQIVDIR